MCWPIDYMCGPIDLGTSGFTAACTCPSRPAIGIPDGLPVNSASLSIIA
jgi:hypothetical protein